MAVLVDAMIFLVALTLLSALVHSTSQSVPSDDTVEVLRSYHSVMLSGDMPCEQGGSMFAVTLADYLMVLAMGGPPNAEQTHLIGEMVNGTIAELDMISGDAWLIIEIGPTSLRFGSEPSGNSDDVYADRRELGDGSVASTLFLSD
jgi:hypothetical protein